LFPIVLLINFLLFLVLNRFVDQNYSLNKDDGSFGEQYLKNL